MGDHGGSRGFARVDLAVAVWGFSRKESERLAGVGGVVARVLCFYGGRNDGSCLLLGVA